jgi:hypothetical protein
MSEELDREKALLQAALSALMRVLPDHAITIIAASRPPGDDEGLMISVMTELEKESLRELFTSLHLRYQSKPETIQ